MNARRASARIAITPVAPNVYPGLPDFYRDLSLLAQEGKSLAHELRVVR